MQKNLRDLAPGFIWNHFYSLTHIPRPSGHEKKAIEYLREFALKSGLEAKIDKTGNLIIKKKAYPGNENARGIILQAHVDMVPQKNSNKTHDFLTDPIETIIDGDWVTADRTTLGADNGIGIAAIMSVLEAKNIKHGPLEALFTISEETTMAGAFGLEPEHLNGTVLLNLDSEDEGELYIGCAGGIDINMNWIYTLNNDLKGNTYKLKLSGLKGGHSGIDINLGRANANKLMLSLLDQLSTQATFQLISFNGGDLRNAIPRESEAVIRINIDETAFNSQLTIFRKELEKQYKGVDDEITLQSEKLDTTEPGMNSDAQVQFMHYLMKIPDGVIVMSESLPGMVQTSNNLAIIKAGKGSIEVKTLLRSSNEKEKMQRAEEIGNIFKQMNANIELCNGYPGWQPNMDSEILTIARRTYQKEFGTEPKVKVIHAGLECGIIGDKMPGLDMISFGPTIRFPHSPDEKVHIKSVNKFWTFVKELLEAAL